MNVARLLVRSARAEARRPAVALGGKVLQDYGRLAARAALLAGAFRQRFGLAEGERVALALENCPQYVELLFGIWWAGLAAVPMNAKLHPSEFGYMLENSGARLAFASPSLAPGLGAAAGGLRQLLEVVEVGTARYERLFEAEAWPLTPQPDEALAWLFYTSGTTGRPKGAMLSHGNLTAMTSCYFADVDAVGPEDAILHAAPMSHGSGLYILPHVAQAALQIVPESHGFEPAEVLEMAAARQGLAFFFAPTMVKRLVEFAAARGREGAFKTCIYGGGPMYLADIKRALALFGNRFVQIYGQGESPMTITALTRAQHGEADHPRWEARLASVGRPQLLVEVRVADEAGRSLPEGGLGEVLVRGPSVMLGYWENPEASREALKDGWLHTGDMGVLDSEGFLSLKDRSKDVIISGGSNIYPRELEEVLLRHPGVLECSVVGRPHPEWGEEVVAFVVPRPDWTAQAGELDRLCLESIARFKRPKDYRFLTRLPKNNYGKVLKTELRRLLAEEQPQG